MIVNSESNKKDKQNIKINKQKRQKTSNYNNLKETSPNRIDTTINKGKMHGRREGGRNTEYR